MFKKTNPPRLELDCTNCNKKQRLTEPENVNWSAVECDVTCKWGSDFVLPGERDISFFVKRRTAKFGCAPVYDANNTVIGARYIFDPAGFGRYQEICGGGCSINDLKPYLGSEFIGSGKRCSAMDIHNPTNFKPNERVIFIGNTNLISHHRVLFGLQVMKVIISQKRLFVWV